MTTEELHKWDVDQGYRGAKEDRFMTHTDQMEPNSVAGLPNKEYDEMVKAYLTALGTEATKQAVEVEYGQAA